MKKSDKKKRSLLGALPAVPYVVWMVLFIAIPLGMVAFFALTEPTGTVYFGKYCPRRRAHERAFALD